MFSHPAASPQDPFTLSAVYQLPLLCCRHFSSCWEHTNPETWASQTFLLLPFKLPQMWQHPGIPSSPGYLSIKSLKILELGSKLSIILDLYCFALLSILLKFGLVFLIVFLLPFDLETILIWWPLTNLALILHCFHLLKPSGICLYSVSASLACLSLWLYFLLLLENVFSRTYSLWTLHLTPPSFPFSSPSSAPIMNFLFISSPGSFCPSHMPSTSYSVWFIGLNVRLVL